MVQLASQLVPRQSDKLWRGGFEDHY